MNKFPPTKLTIESVRAMIAQRKGAQICLGGPFRSGQKVSIPAPERLSRDPAGGIRLICNALRRGVKII
jgi:hypothetical protein